MMRIFKNIKRNLVNLWEFLSKNFFPFIPMILGIGVMLFIGLIVLGFIGMFFKYVGEGELLQDFEPVTEKATQIVSDTPSFIDSSLGGVFSKYVSPFLLEYPFSTFVIIALIVFVLTRITLKRKTNINYKKSILFFIIITYLFYVLNSFTPEQYKSISAFFSIVAVQFIQFVSPDFLEQLSLSIERKHVFIFTYLIIIHWVNSRLLWLLSIAVFQGLFMYINFENIISFTDTIEKEKYRLIQGVIPLVIIAPYVFAMWVFRDNDKYSNFDQKEREINQKHKEISLKERELRLREGEVARKNT